jgi:hypothetical protein
MSCEAICVACENQKSGDTCDSRYQRPVREAFQHTELLLATSKADPLERIVCTTHDAASSTLLGRDQVGGTSGPWCPFDFGTDPGNSREK